MLWHKSADAYEDPDEFRTYLNACIQAIRNVTFILQSQKSEIKDFESWYPKWQEVLKNDPIMRWCVDTRNKIVKSGELEKHSVAIVSYVVSYLEPPKYHFRINPFSSAVEIAQEVVVNHLKAKHRSHGLLKIEKRWVSKDFPDIELLEILAYAFSFLATLLADVEKMKGPILQQNTEGIEKNFNKSIKALKLNKIDLPLCMTSFEEIRTQWLKLPNLEPTQVLIENDKKPEPTKDKIIKRYGGLPTLTPTEKEIKSDLKKQALIFLKQAKKCLKKDKRLATVAFLVGEKNEATIIELRYENYEDKYLMWESVAKEVLKRRAVAIITIGEIWSAPVNPENLEMRPQDSPERKELINVSGLSKEGESFRISVPFYRRWGKIYFKEQVLEENPTLNYLIPIKKVWAKM